MKKIEETKVWKITLKLERFIIILTSWLCVLTIVLGVFLRYIFHADLYGIGEYLVIFAFWLYFMGAAHGVYEKSHIRADIISVYLKNQKLVKLFSILELSISTLAAGVLTFWGFKYLLWGLQKGARSPGWRIPLVIPQSSIFVGFLLMFIYFFIHLIKAIKKPS
jgi:TRAP-type C4-dicarboxylate transport system permease small subunit